MNSVQLEQKLREILENPNPVPNIELFAISDKKHSLAKFKQIIDKLRYGQGVYLLDGKSTMIKHMGTMNGKHYKGITVKYANGKQMKGYLEDYKQIHKRLRSEGLI